MTDEEPLPFARKHAQLLGDRFGRKMEDFYKPRILDEPYFLQRLCRLGPGAVLPANPGAAKERLHIRWPVGGGAAGPGGTILEDVLWKQEKVMSAALDTDTVTFYRSLDSAPFLDVSEQARKLWATQPALYQRRMTQCSHLSNALVLRKTWLNQSHADSAEVFYGLG